MKVQINLSDELVQKIDNYAKSMGVSRSALCGVWLGQVVMGIDKTLETTQTAISNYVQDIGVIPEAGNNE